MSRVIRFTPQKDRNGMQIGAAEGIVIVVLVIAIFAGLRYYFVTYRNTPAYALGLYLGAVKSGNPQAQYDMLDEADQRSGTLAEYKKLPIAHGYASRIENVAMSPEQPAPNNPNVVTVDATLSVRGTSKGKELYQTSGQTINDTFTLRKNSKGKWKVWISKWKRELLKVEPSPEGDPI